MNTVSTGISFGAARPLQGSLILRVVVLLHAGKEFFRRQNYMDELQ